MGDLSENGSEKVIVITDDREKQDFKLKKCPPGSRNGSLHENGHDGDVQPQLNGVTTARGEKITNLEYVRSIKITYTIFSIQIKCALMLPSYKWQL